MPAACGNVYGALDPASLSMSPRDFDLTVSVVTYYPESAELLSTFNSLAESLNSPRARNTIRRVRLDLIDNGSAENALEKLLEESELSKLPSVQTRIVRGHGNIGYGRGHNLSLLEAGSPFYLVLNPDVTLADSTIAEAVSFLSAHPEVVMLSPEVRDAGGQKQYLCRDEPTLFALYLRSFAPGALRSRFRRVLEQYELRSAQDAGAAIEVPFATGCFMFGRTKAFQQVGGFSSSYFLYFEDYDLCKRLRAGGPIVYVPEVQIRHDGGNTSRKGWKHIGLFVRSAFTFFSEHGWRLA